MCTAPRTQLSCGHVLVGPLTPCAARCGRVRPIGSHLPNTCAACDPERRLRALRQAYEALHGRLVAGLRAAVARQDGAAAQRLEELVMRAVRGAGQEAFLITLERDAVEVPQPGLGPL